MNYKKELNFIKDRKNKAEENSKPSKYGMTFFKLDRISNPIYFPQRKKKK